MRYKICTNGELFKLQGKNFIFWYWLDECGEWCNWYGKDNPMLFTSKKKVLNYLKNRIWRTDGEMVV